LPSSFDDSHGDSTRNNLSSSSLYPRLAPHFTLTRTTQHFLKNS
jgi:hypothetical protein